MKKQGNKVLSKFINRNLSPPRNQEVLFYFCLFVFLQRSAVFKPVVSGGWRQYDAHGGHCKRHPHHERCLVPESNILSSQDVLFSKQVIWLNSEKEKCENAFISFNEKINSSVASHTKYTRETREEKLMHWWFLMLHAYTFQFILVYVVLLVCCHFVMAFRSINKTWAFI